MTRTSVTVPLPCYGSEYEQADPRCKACPHSAPCINAHGRRAGRIKLSQARFEFAPHELGAFAVQSNFIEEYRQAHEQVFGADPTISKLVRTPLFQEQVEANAEAAGVTSSAFLLTTMYAYKSTRAEDAHFSPKSAVDIGALQRVQTFTDAARRLYASKSEHAITSLFEGQEDRRVKDAFLHNEIDYGGFVVGTRIRSNAPFLASYYSRYEIRMDPLWLLTDQEYLDYAFSAETREDVSTGITAHRARVAHAKGELQRERSKRKIKAVFALRSASIRPALEHVLGAYGITPSDLETSSAVFTDPGLFWRRVGLAIQHVFCLRYYEGDRAARRLIGGTVL